MIPSVGRIIHVARTSEPQYRTPTSVVDISGRAFECRPAIVVRIGYGGIFVNVFWLRGAYPAWAQTWHDPRECPNAPTETGI